MGDREREFKFGKVIGNLSFFMFSFHIIIFEEKKRLPRCAITQSRLPIKIRLRHSNRKEGHHYSCHTILQTSLDAAHQPKPAGNKKEWGSQADTMLFIILVSQICLRTWEKFNQRSIGPSN